MKSTVINKNEKFNTLDNLNEFYLILFADATNEALKRCAQEQGKFLSVYSQRLNIFNLKYEKVKHLELNMVMRPDGSRSISTIL